jgi:hypothetical protein
VRARHRYRVGLAAILQQPLPLALPDPELLGLIVEKIPVDSRCLTGTHCIAHGEPA